MLGIDICANFDKPKLISDRMKRKIVLIIIPFFLLGIRSTFSIDTLKVHSDSVHLKILKESQSDSILMQNKDFSPIVENDRIWGVTKDTIFTTLITILIFALGLLFQQLYQKRKEKQRLVDVKIYFDSLLDNVIHEFLPNQIKLFDQFYKEININTGIPITYNKVDDSNLRRILQVNQNDIFNIVRKNKPADVYIKKYKMVISRLDFINSVLNLTKEFHQYILSDSKVSRETLQELVEDYLNLLTDYLGDAKKKEIHSHINDPMWNFINTEVFLFYEKNNKTIEDFYNHLLRPIQVELITKHYHLNDDYADKIIHLGKTITTKRFHLRYSTVEVKLQFRTFTRYLRESEQSIKDNLV